MQLLLLGLHAVLGEIGLASFIWVAVELANDSEKAIKRAHIAAWIGLVALLLSWEVGGMYFASFYQDGVQQAILASEWEWVDTVLTQFKVHLFLFLPFLAMLAVGGIAKLKERRAVLWLSVYIVIFGAIMSASGFLIASTYRAAVEALL